VIQSRPCVQINRWDATGAKARALDDFGSGGFGEGGNTLNNGSKNSLLPIIIFEA
jgi:hypothetical protein